MSEEPKIPPMAELMLRLVALENKVVEIATLQKDTLVECIDGAAVALAGIIEALIANGTLSRKDAIDSIDVTAAAEVSKDPRRLRQIVADQTMLRLRSRA